MTSSNRYDVALQVAEPRPLAAVHARIRAGTAGQNFRSYLDQVYAAGRSGAVNLDGQNVFVYRSVPGATSQTDVAFGVGVTAPFIAVDSVVPTTTPAGEVVTTTHWGSYAALGQAHSAIDQWCRSNGRRKSGTSWEVYGHWTDDEASLRTDVFYLLDPVE